MAGRVVAAVALLFCAACVAKSNQACDPAVDDGCASIGSSNACTKDADCGDGSCRNGVCVHAPPVSTDTACASVSCPAGDFCANGVCLPETAQCKQPDPACIYIPHGAFEPPVHQWWWPWQTPQGPDDTTGHAALRSDVEYPDYTQVMSTPVVMRLHKSDPAPAVVFNSFSPNQGYVVESQGVMRAVRGTDGAPIWTAPKDMWNNLDHSIDGNASIAAGDCKGDGTVCFITGGWDPNDLGTCQSNGVCKGSGNRCSNNGDCNHQHGGLIAFDGDGNFLWLNRDARVWWGAPAIAHLLGPTGPAQVVVGNGVYDGATGKTLCPQTTVPLDQVGGNGDGTETAIADIDLDGIPEIVTGNQAYKLLPSGSSPTGYVCKGIMGPNGQGVQMTGGRSCVGGYGSACPDGFPAIGNFAGYGALMGLDPKDPHPQVVVVSRGTLRIQDWTGGILLSPIPLPADATCNGEFNEGGSPTIADFDGDGLPEVGIAGQGAYLVWKPGANYPGFIWEQKTRDCSANTGSSVFDFEGKGQADVVYSDQCDTRIYDGRTGAVLASEKNSSCTAYEMPIVADIDGSGRAKVLVPNNNICNYFCDDWPGGGGYQQNSSYVGLKALASPTDKWVNTRSVWNEHTYHITNVGLDGSLPFPEPPSWVPGKDGFNTFRQNVQGQGMFAAPDLSICEVQVDMTACAQSGATVTGVVYNGGAIPVKAGVKVRFEVVLANGSTATIGEAVTQTGLAPGASEKVSAKWVAPPQSQAVSVRATVDPDQAIGDCHPENNVATSTAVKCGPLG